MAIDMVLERPSLGTPGQAVEETQPEVEGPAPNRISDSAIQGITLARLGPEPTKSDALLQNENLC
jgi:hypothetical protein